MDSAKLKERYAKFCRDRDFKCCECPIQRPCRRANVTIGPRDMNQSEIEEMHREIKTQLYELTDIVRHAEG